MVGVDEGGCVLLSEIPDLVLKAHGLLYDILVAVIGDFLVESLKLSGDKK